jgi:hypothetical protein
MIDPYYVPILKLSPEALTTWLRMKGVSFFPEELLAIEHLIDADRKKQIAAEIERLLAERKSRPSPAETPMMPAAREIAVKMR